MGLTDVVLCRRWLFAPSWTERTGRNKLLQSVFVTHDSQSSKSKAPEINDFYRRMNNAALVSENASRSGVCACLVRLISSNDHVFLRSATRWLCCENVRMCVRVDTCVSMTLPALYISQLKMYVGMYCV